VRFGTDIGGTTTVALVLDDTGRVHRDVPTGATAAGDHHAVPVAAIGADLLPPTPDAMEVTA
jgi:predicted NBD/HSP70 family sugar kinase